MNSKYICRICGQPKTYSECWLWNNENQTCECNQCNRKINTLAYEITKSLSNMDYFQKQDTFNKIQELEKVMDINILGLCVRSDGKCI